MKKWEEKNMICTYISKLKILDILKTSSSFTSMPNNWRLQRDSKKQKQKVRGETESEREVERE